MRDIDPRVARLREQVKPVTTHLWIPADAVTFTPAVLSTVYGDGRALFRITTINDRPQYWLVIGDSQWAVSDYSAPEDAPEFNDMTDEILSDIEAEFMSARCGYSRASLREPIGERGCDCEECQEEKPEDAEYPVIDAEGGCSWGRMDWPAEFDVVRHPWACCNILADTTP